MLVDGAERARGGRALAALAQALGPELAEPHAEEGKTVDIGHDHVAGDAAALLKRDCDRCTHRGRQGRGLGSRIERPDDGARALAHGSDIDAGHARGQQADEREDREAPADARIMVEHGDAEALGMLAHGIVARLGDHGEVVPGLALAHGRAHGCEAQEELSHRLGGGTGLRDGKEARAPQLDGAQQALETRGVDRVEEAQARRSRERPEALAGKGCQGLPAETGA